ncbi:MAG: hypothetical protein K6G34_06740 [Lachnospiraceae bacterium]|nr:hypothetical protein [Lachnospiraceae bacterium]
MELRRTRYKTMIFVIGKKLRRLLPDGVFDNTSDPLARDRSFIWGSNLDGDMVFHEPADPDKSIWCAEVTTAGRGKNKKQGVVLMSANCGFAVIAPLPEVPAIRNMSDEEWAEMEWQEQREVEKQNKALLREYREQLRDTFISAIREGMLKFCLPENRVLDYTDTVARVEFIKGKKTTPGIRLAEFIDRCLDWKSGDDPVARYNIRSNWTDRKFGYGDYRHVDAAVRKMLEMDSDESRQWLDAFMEAMRERMTARS